MNNAWISALISCELKDNGDRLTYNMEAYRNQRYAKEHDTAANDNTSASPVPIDNVL